MYTILDRIIYKNHRSFYNPYTNIEKIREIYYPIDFITLSPKTAKYELLPEDSNDFLFSF